MKIIHNNIITYVGRFKKIPSMCTELVVPDLTGFPLRAYVAPGAKRNIREAVVNLNDSAV